ncbi:MAG: fused MFS/spermidine synthase [Elusimicrobia bacterium]|nr:fused MFS/spermidine synthase [Elusimicrobiota bacterium]
MKERSARSWFFLFFFVSGFYSLIYEVVWLRLAMAQFGVNTALVALFLSSFMAGLGSYAAGRRFGGTQSPGAASALRFYAATEAAVAVFGAAVPSLLSFGRFFLNGAGSSWNSSSYYFASGAWILGALIVPCVCMGAAVPLAVAALRTSFPETSRGAFSALYLANVLGAAFGALASAFVFIELFGLRGTLRLATVLNAATAVAIAGLSLRIDRVPRSLRPPSAAVSAPAARGRRILGLLFLTGCAGMALEVIWSRVFSAYLGTFVYTFAGILSLYLAATFAGAQAYRARAADAARRREIPWPLIGLAGAATLLWIDPRLPLSLRSIGAGLTRLSLSVVPFCAALGFVTPMLVDEYSGGDPRRVGTAYAVNVMGAIAGPLLAGFALLPFLRERWALLVVLSPFFILGTRPSAREKMRLLPLLAAALLAVVTHDFENGWRRKTVRRDATATVVAVDADQYRNKRLFINGIGTTTLSPTTKVMVHLPLLLSPRPPRSGLVICFGMGTSFRSMMSWGIATTVVELVPSVPKMIGVFHKDGPELLRSPSARVVIDDGRRFLERSRDSFDVIVVDPPPPEEAAGSSLLYSREFYALARRRLAPGGILQQWHMGEDPATLASVARALRQEFAYVRVFGAIEGRGFHFLASDSPIADVPASVLARRLPPKAERDLLEWGPYGDARQQLGAILSRELPLDELLRAYPSVPALDDDRPFNEYFFLRRELARR